VFKYRHAAGHERAHELPVGHTGTYPEWWIHHPSPLLYCSRTSLFAWYNLDYLLSHGYWTRQWQLTLIISTKHPIKHLTSKWVRRSSLQASESGPPAVTPNDDVSTNSMNVAEDINGMMGPEFYKTANRNRERHPSYTGTDRKAPSGEHLRFASAITDKQATRRYPSSVHGRSVSYPGKFTNGSWTKRPLQP
jgi:hypothetical protein